MLHWMFIFGIIVVASCGRLQLLLLLVLETYNVIFLYELRNRLRGRPFSDVICVDNVVYLENVYP